MGPPVFWRVAFAPLQLDSHNDYQIQYDWDEASMAYEVQVHTDTPQIAQLDYEANEFDEQEWPLHGRMCSFGGG